MTDEDQVNVESFLLAQVEKKLKKKAQKAPGCADDAPPKGESVGLGDLSPARIQQLKDEGIRKLDKTLEDNLGGKEPGAISAAKEFGQGGGAISLMVACIEDLGHVGERRNCGLTLLGLASSRLPSPLHTLIKGQSSSGKSHMLATTARILPPELVYSLTEMTPKFLAYIGMFDLTGKVVVMGERTLGDEELVAATNKFRREMISQGYVVHATVEADEHGKNASRTRLVIGPIASSETTTKDAIFAEDQNRAIVLEIDLSEEQTRTILDYQAAEAQGDVPGLNVEQLEMLHNFFRLLRRPKRIRIPFAGLVTALVPTKNVEVRRIQRQVFGLIEVCAFLHQMQRPAIGEDGEPVAWEGRTNGEGVLVAAPRDYEIVANMVNPSLTRALRQAVTESDLLVFRHIQDLVRQRDGSPPPAGFSTTDLSRKIAHDTGKLPDGSNLRKQLRALQGTGAIRLVQQGHPGSPNQWELVQREGVLKSAGWSLPPTYEQLCEAYTAATGTDVPDGLRLNAFKDEPWAMDLGAAEREWGTIDEGDLEPPI